MSFGIDFVRFSVEIKIFGMVSPFKVPCNFVTKDGMPLNANGEQGD